MPNSGASGSEDSSGPRGHPRRSLRAKIEGNGFSGFLSALTILIAPQVRGSGQANVEGSSRQLNGDEHTRPKTLPQHPPIHRMNHLISAWRANLWIQHLESLAIGMSDQGKHADKIKN